MDITEKAWRTQETIARVAELHQALVAVGVGLSRVRVGSSDAQDKISIWTGNDRYEIHKKIREVFGTFGIVETKPPVGASDDNPIYVTDAVWAEHGLVIDTDPYLGYVDTPRAPYAALRFVLALHEMGLPVDSVSTFTRQYGVGTAERVTVGRHGPRDPMPQDLADRLTELTGADPVRFLRIDWVADKRVLVSVIKARPELRIPAGWALQGMGNPV